MTDHILDKFHRLDIYINHFESTRSILMNISIFELIYGSIAEFLLTLKLFFEMEMLIEGRVFSYNPNLGSADVYWRAQLHLKYPQRDSYQISKQIVLYLFSFDI